MKAAWRCTATMSYHMFRLQNIRTLSCGIGEDLCRNYFWFLSSLKLTASGSVSAELSNKGSESRFFDYLIKIFSLHSIHHGPHIGLYYCYAGEWRNGFRFPLRHQFSPCHNVHTGWGPPSLLSKSTGVFPRGQSGEAWNQCYFTFLYQVFMASCLIKHGNNFKLLP